MPQTLDHPQHSILPTPLTGLIGREQDLLALTSLICRDDVRIVTLTGPGGTGKTRLALEAGARLQPHFDNRVFFVALASVKDSAVVVPTIAHALGIHEQGEQALLESIVVACGEQRLLLLLDNFEQITDAAIDIAELLTASAHITVLVTSRSPLRIRGEREFPVLPLPTPDPTRLPSLSELANNPAVALFIELAQTTRPDLTLTLEQAPAIAEICARLDGLPLALELAAARVKLLPPAAMLSRLANRLGLLTAGPRDLPERQQTLRNAVAWSHDLLSPDEQALFRRLSVFPGGCTLEAAEAVCGSALDGIESLVDQSLLQQSERELGEPRFVMMETIREFASEQLSLSGEESELRNKHLTYFSILAEDAGAGFAGADQGKWLNIVQGDLANVRAALEWAIEQHHASTAQRMTSALLYFWQARGHLSEGRSWHERALALPGDPDASRARALSSAATLARRQGDFDRATVLYQESLTIYRALEAHGSVGSTLNNLGVIALQHDQLAQADGLFEEALTVFRELDDRSRTAAVLNNLGMIARRQKQFAKATELYRETLDLHRALGDQVGAGLAFNNLGVLSYDQGETARAAALYDESLTIFRVLDDRLNTALALHNLAEAVRDQGDFARAAELYAESLTTRAEQGDRNGIAECLSGLAGLAQRRDLSELGVKLASAADSLRRDIGVPLSASQKESQDRLLSEFRRRLSAEAFSASWQAGNSLTIAAAAALGAESAKTMAEMTAPAVTDVELSAAVSAGLTKREVDVLRLVVEGQSDKEIGESLFISHRTAMTHVMNILNKLGVSSRTAAAAWAIRNGLDRAKAS